MLSDNFIVVEISAEESEWKWNLRFQIMLVFQKNLRYLLQLISDYFRHLEETKKLILTRKYLES